MATPRQRQITQQVRARLDRMSGGRWSVSAPKIEKALEDAGITENSQIRNLGLGVVGVVAAGVGIVVGGTAAAVAGGVAALTVLGVEVVGMVTGDGD